MISEFEFAIISKNNNLYFTLFFYYKVLIYLITSIEQVI